MINLETASIKEIATYFSHEVNNFCFRPEKIAEEQKDSKHMIDLDLCWIKLLSSSTYRTDLRNEMASQMGKRLAEIFFIKRKMGLVDNPKMEEVAKKMAMDHRTLQQTFSGLIFYHFLQICNKEESEELSKTMGNTFYKLPLI